MPCRRLVLPVALVGLALSSPAAAQATRTWVSGVGDDVNPCSRTAPCKTFAGAISKTAAAGEISVLDPGGFGALTITKSISIVAQGHEGGVLAAMTNGLTINAGPGDAVYIRGLVIEGAGTGLNGVRVVSAGTVLIENTVIRGFRSAADGAGSAVRVVGPARVTVVGGTLADNLTGVTADAPEAQVWIARSTITGNRVAVDAKGGAKVRSYGDNAIHGNGSDGSPLTEAPAR
jgi:hypothetical protein